MPSPNSHGLAGLLSRRLSLAIKAKVVGALHSMAKFKDFAGRLYWLGVSSRSVKARLPYSTKPPLLKVGV
ncbi:hypothetical protein D3C85_1220490 [compost metagenome]